MHRLRLAPAAFLLSTLAPAAVWADGPMTFPQVIDRNAEYRTAWKAITAEIRPGDKEGRFLRVLNGPATQMLATNTAGRHLLVGFVCEIHNCDANSVTVVIEPSSSRMWAVQRRRIDVPLRYRFLGQPDQTMRAVLVRQAELGDLPLEERLKH
ncbi:Ivy family c-type lysozyme inhibitor [Methylorubrum populi]